MSERGLYQRDPCVCCERMSDMLYLKENNRMCDICKRGPVCFNCYRSQWLDPCVCVDCFDQTTLDQIIDVPKTPYEPKFYLPNIRPVCDTCESKHAEFICSCREVFCVDCIPICEKCNERYCNSCDIWSSDECGECGDPDFDGTQKNVYVWETIKTF